MTENQKNPLIQIRQVRHNNLKGFDLDIPVNAITVITGRSGSGKSTLAVDVLHAYAQITYMESVGMALGNVPPKRPDVLQIKGIMPSVCIESQSNALFYGATVASVCDLDYLLRLMFSQAGTFFCPLCQKEIVALNPDQIVKKLAALKEGTKLTLLAPVAPTLEMLGRLQADGFTRVRLNGVVLPLEDALGHAKELCSLEAVIDRIVVRHGIFTRLSDSVRLCLKVSGKVVRALIQGIDSVAMELSFSTQRRCTSCEIDFDEPTSSLFSPFSEKGRCPTCKGKKQSCETCKGTGLNEIARSYKVGGKNIAEFMQMTLDEFEVFLQAIKLEQVLPEKQAQTVFETISDAISMRLVPVKDMGLGYLILGRRSVSISGGELQRLRLGAQLGRDMRGVLYILDEPSCGLHPVEQQALWGHLKRLKEAGNTVVVIEHELDALKNADFCVELGPGSGKNGGELLFAGDASEAFLRHCAQKKGFVRKKRTNTTDFIKASNLNANNLKSLSIKLPLNKLVCITGVSGSGKTTLAKTCLYTAILAAKNDQHNRLSCFPLEMPYPLDVKYLEQRPLAISKYSMPATYIGIFSHIRQLFSQTKQARTLGLTAGYFSLSRKGGRCEACEGMGIVKKVMDVMPSLEFVCDVCEGRRYNQDCLEITYKGLNLFDVLELTVEEALQFFARYPQIAQPLKGLERAGLGYLKLGQNARTLSGGEAQRIRLAQSIYKEYPDKTLYFLDEPSRGLHIQDIINLLHLIDELLDKGHSVVVIEHNQMFLENADWILELGAGGGENGGYLIAEGKPEQVCECDTPTGRFLRQTLK